ncbi:hypothetical protein BGZ81_006967 [Podila clonocystis]|nr:hypothetical protein BGZ81_006967 [Podila clonocystis]
MTKPKKGPRPQLPKPAKRIPRPITLHNETLIDNYRWMHQIDKDPDVRAYINAEMEYTKSWVHYSGIEKLQKQLEKEMQQIKNAMVTESFLDGLDDDNDIENDHDGSSEILKKPSKKRLEGTQFWDIDRWRYWLDSTEGDYGVYKRRPIPENGYLRAMQQKRAEYMPSPAFDYGQSNLNTHASSGAYFGGCSDGAQTAQGFYASDVPISVQTVLDVNHIAKKQKQHSDQGEFSFGSIEIQPRYTFLRRSIPSEEDSIIERPEEPEYTFVAYTFDTSGDERYKVKITTIANAPPEYGNVPNVNDRTYTMKECLITGSGSLGSALDNAGPETRWLKIGRSLYLYFTKLDTKGLPREVWRVLVESFDTNPDQGQGFSCGEDELNPELVMREEDERNVLALSQTNDHRYLLIESSGQTTSRTYFWSVGNPEKGWNLIRQSEDNVVYKVEHHSGYFYLRTNHGDSVNFKVIRVPVALYDNSSLATPLISRNRQDHTSNTAELPSGGCFLNCMDDETVIEHDPNEFLERFETFVEHFVAWVWRAGLQEIRIFHAPHPGNNDPEKWPLTELERLRPYDKNYKVATVMPSNIRDEEERLMRDFYNTRLRYSNCSFVHPWALYEYNMHTLTPTVLSRMDEGDREDNIRKATRLVCRDTFPLGVHYGKGKSLIANSRTMSPIDDLDIHDRIEKDPWKEQDKEIAKFKEMRLMVPSTHSTMNGPNPDDQVPVLIPVSLVYYNLPEHNFPRAAFVKAYGAYGTMTSAMFEPEVDLPLLHRGLIIVQVHPRGDGVLGPQWYKDGKAANKTNTFYDVEDVLLYLRNSGMVQPASVVIEGRSAGGLVSGWIANRWGENPIPKETIGDQRDRGQENIVKEMVKVVLAQVPFVDVIGDMTNKDVAWVEYEWAEWGNPMESVEVFEVMKNYSPYERIRNQPYPAMMIMGGLSDSRVNYAEPLKFVAKLRSVDGKTNDCQSPEDADSESNEEEGEGDPEEDQEDKKKKKKEMCAGKKDTALLLQMEDGGHFSGNSSLWLAFALHHLDTTKVLSE